MRLRGLSKARGDATYAPINPANWTQGNGTYQLVRAPSTARKVIFATDWYSDVDDPIAARVLLYYEKIGYVDCLAATCNTTAPSGAPSMDAFFRAHGRSMQIGQLAAASSDLSTEGPYQPNMAANNPHIGTHASMYPDSVTVHRTALAASADGSVDFISVGYLNGLQALLQSPGDSISALTGLQLVTAKVRKLWVMGGNWPTGSENNFNRSTLTKAAANYVVANWPTPITFLGFEVGSSVTVGDTLPALAPQGDVLMQALVDYGSPTGRPAWDPLLTVLACVGDATACGYTTVQGTAAVNASTGANTWTNDANGLHQYVVKNKTDAEFAADVNNLLVPGFETIPTGVSFRETPRPTSLPRITGTVQVDTLPVLARMKASDNKFALDGATALYLPSHAGGGPIWQQTTSNLRPTYRANIGGRACFEFTGSGVRFASSSAVTFPAGITVLARVRWAVLPTSNQSIATADSGTRLWHLKAITGSIIQAVNFSGGTGQTDNSAASLVAMRYTGTTLEALIDGASNGATTTGGAANTGALAVTIGARNDATEPVVGYIADVKVVSGFANDTQLAALSADM
jgi:purine nucleosidase